MKSKYIFRLIFKEWLPMIIVFSIVSLLSLIIAFSNLDLYDTSSKLNLLALTIPFTILAIILPLFVYNYRFSLKSSDTFYQLPFKEKEMRNIRVLAGLIALMGALLVCFLIGFLFFVIKYYSSPAVEVSKYYSWDDVTETYISIEKPFDKVTFQPLVFLSVLPIVLLGIAFEYFISCFITSLVNKQLPALLLNGSLQVFLFGLISSILSLILHNYDTSSLYPIHDTVYEGLSYSLIYSLEFAPGFVFPNGLPAFITTNYVLNPVDEIKGLTDFVPLFFVGMIVVSSLVGLVSAFFTFYMKEPSGEHSGNYGLYKPTFNFIIYLSVIPVILFAGSNLTKNISLYLVFDIILTAGYYFLNTMFLGTFKVKKYNYIIIGAIFVLFFLSYAF